MPKIQKQLSSLFNLRDSRVGKVTLIYLDFLNPQRNLTRETRVSESHDWTLRQF